MLNIKFTGTFSGREVNKREAIRMRGEIGTLPKLPEMSGSHITVLEAYRFRVTPSEDMDMEGYEITVYDCCDESGEKIRFQSSSEIFYRAVEEMYEDLEGIDVTIEVRKIESKKQTGYYYYRPVLLG